MTDSGREDRLSQAEPQEGLVRSGFDPARDDGAEIIATHSFKRAMAGDGVAALMAAGVTARRKLKGERDTELIKRIGQAYLSACYTLTILDALAACDSDGPRMAETPLAARGEAGPARAEGIAQPKVSP